MGLFSNLFNSKELLASVKMDYYSPKNVCIGHEGKESYLNMLYNYYLDKSIYNTQNVELIRIIASDLERIQDDMKKDKFKEEVYELLNYEFKKSNESIEFEIKIELFKKGDRIFAITNYHPLTVNPNSYVEKSINHLFAYVMKNISCDLQKALVFSLLMQYKLYEKVDYPLNVKDVSIAPTVVYSQMLRSDG